MLQAYPENRLGTIVCERLYQPMAVGHDAGQRIMIAANLATRAPRAGTRVSRVSLLLLAHRVVSLRCNDSLAVGGKVDSGRLSARASFCLP
jgi:hypothetical protein